MGASGRLVLWSGAWVLRVGWYCGEVGTSTSEHIYK